MIGGVRVWKGMVGYGTAWNSIQHGRKHKSEKIHLQINSQKIGLVFDLERHGTVWEAMEGYVRTWQVMERYGNALRDY